MKKFSELSQIDTNIPVQDIQLTEQIPSDNFTNDVLDIPDLQNSVSGEADSPFPDYMLNDSNYVGYESQKYQYTLYRSAEFGAITTGVETVLDVGCGRGDFGDYLLNRYPNIKYTGIDMSDLAIRIGQYKYSETYSEFRYLLQQAVFDNNSITEQRFDYVFHINNLSIDYGVFPGIQSENNRYEYLKQLIQKSLDICNIGVIFTLYNESTEFEGQLQYSLTPISKILYDMNLKFAIDNTDIPEVFKLVILKKPF